MNTPTLCSECSESVTPGALRCKACGAPFQGRARARQERLTIREADLGVGIEFGMDDIAGLLNGGEADDDP